MKQTDLDKYATLMHEARIRLSVLRDFLSGAANTTYLRTNTESMCLQLRKILELIAFATLVCHHEAYIKVRQDIAKDWHGNRILKAVEGINSTFYPRAVRGWKSNSQGRPSLNKMRGGYLSRNQFAKLYDMCGDLLHSTNPFAMEQNFAGFSSKSPVWIQRVEELLIEHTVSLAQSNELLWVHVPMNLDEPVVVRHLVGFKA